METENFIRDQVKKILSESSRNFSFLSDNYSRYAKANSSDILNDFDIRATTISSASTNLESSKLVIIECLKNEYFNRIFDGAFLSGSFLYVNVKKDYVKSGYKVYQAARYIGAIITACVEKRLFPAPRGIEVSYDTGNRQVRMKFK